MGSDDPHLKPLGEHPSPTLQYASLTKSSRRMWVNPVIYVAVSLLISIVLFAVLNLKGGSRLSTPREKCGSNLRQIGQAMHLYANDHRGEYPDSFRTLIASMPDEISTELFCCPSTALQPARGATTQATLASFSAGQHCSYLYFIKGVTPNSNPNIIVACEPLTDHSDGINALFNDGHIEFIGQPAAQNLLNRISAATQPIVWQSN